MATKLYVGNLPFDAAETDVLELFKQAGDVVSCSIIIDRVTNRSKGFGFVEMGSQEEAQKAISQINGRELDGRTLTVNEARPRPERSSHDFRRNNGHRPERESSSPERRRQRY